MHICLSKLTIIGWDNGLLPGRRQAIIWTNAGILLIGPLGINFCEILIKIFVFSFNKPITPGIEKGDVSYLTDSPVTTRSGMCNSVADKESWQL